MRKQLSNRGFRVVLSLFIVCVMVGVFLKYSEPASSQKARVRPVSGKVGLEPVSSQAVAFAVSPPVSEIAASQEEPGPFKYRRPLTKKEYRDEQEEQKQIGPVVPLTEDEEAEREKNPTNAKPIRWIDEKAVPSPDEAIFTGIGKGKSPLGGIPTPTSFEGQSIHDTILLGQGFLPPDTVGDVGPNHYVQAVNVTFRIYNKAGVALTPVATMGSLFAALPGTSLCEGNDGDPIVNYDSFADRWIITQFVVQNNPDHQCFAVSQTPDPTGAYFLYDFVMPNAKINDYPKIGVWPDGYYMSNNQFNQAGTAFQGAGMYAFNRAKMLAGDATANFIYFDSCPTSTGCDIGGMLPSDADGLTPPPAGAPNVFAYFTAVEFTDPADAIRLFNFHADFTTPANSTFIERAGSPLAVAAFNPLTPAGRDHIEQPPPAVNTTMALDSIGDRLMHRLQYRNFGTHESLITNHTVNVGTGTTQALHQAGVRYYELRSTGGGNYAVNEQASFAPDTVNRFMGSAAMDRQGNIAVGYTVSDATSVFPGVRVAGRLAGDAPNGLPQGEAVMQAGGFIQANTASRWGDYSSTNVDPTDDCTFWHTNEYFLADEATTAEWHTRIGSFKVNPSCVAPAQGRVVVNVTNCETGLPVQGVSVTINNNLYGSTAATGAFGSQLSPGGYTAVISSPDYFPATPIPFMITDGNTTTINACLLGAPDIDASGSAITAESCAPADNALSPNETVTVSFGLRNSGVASTTNLVATLQATGGVTSPSGPQNYGAIPPDNTTVVQRPFTFTVDPSLLCGDVLTATFQLQDGATNLGTVTFTFNIGAATSPATAVYSSGNIAVPIPDVSSVDIPINIPDTGLVNDVNVRVRLNHTFDGDLAISLVSPAGTIIPLATNRGGAGDNFGTGANDCSGAKTVFDDSAATAISAGTAPFAGSFRPESPLTGLNGASVTGTWRLRVADTAALDVGTIGCVELEVRRLRFVCCGVAGTPTIVSGGPADVIAESFVPPNDAPDPGEIVTVNLPLLNTGTGNTTNLVATLLPTGGVASPGGPQNYGVVVAGGPAVTRPFTFAAQGACGSTITMTLALQDGALNLGTVTYTLQMGTTVIGAPQTFSNATPIIIPATGTSGPAAPYPSTINVAGVVGNVSKVTATLRNMNHTFPDDIDILLVGPGGQKILIMSDAGGSADLVNNTYTFDDAAAATLADGALNATGTYRPSNFGTGDTFPAPAPVGPYPDPQLLSVFNGVNPNGTWSLYVVDDVGGDVGNINLGWDLAITTSQNVCIPPPVGVANLGITKTDGTTTVTAGGMTTYTIVASNAGPSAVTGAVVTDNFPNTITSVTWTCVGAGGGSCPVPPNGTGNINALVNLPVGGTVTFTAVAQISPSATFGMSNVATITPPAGTTDPFPANNTARDVDNICSGTTFSNPAAITIPAGAPGVTSGPANPYPSNITVSGMPTTISGITVTLTGFNHTFPDDVDILLVSPTGRKMIIMSDVGSLTDAVNLNITLDDAAAAILPDGGPLVSGTFRPTNIGTGDTFVAPAPVGPYLTPATAGTDTLTSAFTGGAGGNPNGTWSLYVVDDLGGDVGSFSGGWSLTLTACPTTAAGVSVSGRVLTPDGRGLRNARVVITDSLGNPRTVTTSAFGFYQFDDVAVGESYVIGVVSKLYRFQSQIIQVNDTLTNVDFVGLE